MPLHCGIDDQNISAEKIESLETPEGSMNFMSSILTGKAKYLFLIDLLKYISNRAVDFIESSYIFVANLMYVVLIRLHVLTVKL